MTKRLLMMLSWSVLWLVFFWTFLIIGFPSEAARGWIADKLGKGLNANVFIEGMKIMWDLDVKLKGIAISNQESAVGSQEPSALSPQPSTFGVKLHSLNIEPRLISLIRLKPEIDFNGSTPTGGSFSGSYNPDNLSVSFKDISFKDVSISTIPVPSAASMGGSGDLKFSKGKGTIEVEVDGIPGGRQRLKVSGGENPGLDGKLKITVSLPKI